jgi:hypothetical protein
LNCYDARLSVVMRQGELRERGLKIAADMMSKLRSRLKIGLPDPAREQAGGRKTAG